MPAPNENLERIIEEQQRSLQEAQCPARRSAANYEREANRLRAQIAGYKHLVRLAVQVMAGATRCTKDMYITRTDVQAIMHEE